MFLSGAKPVFVGHNTTGRTGCERWPLWSVHLQEVFGTVPFRSLHLWKQLECYSRASWRGVSWKNTKKAFGRWILPSTWHLLFFLGPNFWWIFVASGLEMLLFFTKILWKWSMMDHEYMHSIVYAMSCRIWQRWSVMKIDDPWWPFNKVTQRSSLKLDQGRFSVNIAIALKIPPVTWTSLTQAVCFTIHPRHACISVKILSD